MPRKNLKHTWLLAAMLLAVAMLSACRPVTAPAGQAAGQAAAATPAAAAEKPAPKPEKGSTNLVLATTTSTQDSGLLDYLIPTFEQETGSKVAVIAVGTGQSLKLGADCNADVVLVHARAQEDKFMMEGSGNRREDVMYNDFVVLGPKDDPAKIKGMSAADAFKAIADAQAKFISRGDQSGTNTKELAIWKTAGIEPKGDWYISAGQGMGAVLNMANEQQAYTLSDRATYLARAKKGLDLEILVEGDKTLFNPYGVITVNPEKCPNVNAELGNKFADWLVSVPVQQKIGEFGKDQYGQALFTPDSTAWKNR